MMKILEHRQPCLYRYYPDYYKHTALGEERQGVIIGRDVENNLFKVLDEEHRLEFNLPMEDVAVQAEPFIFLQEQNDD
tara:strand:+ start:272 stop:505 length:234 start_codon:yes stop_codon:yes gene_type:complete